MQSQVSKHKMPPLPPPPLSLLQIPAPTVMLIGLAAMFMSLSFTKKRGPTFWVFKPGIFIWLRSLARKDSQLAAGMRCHLCVAFWIAVALVALRIAFGGEVDYVIAPFAAAGLATTTASLSGVPFPADREAEDL